MADDKGLKVSGIGILIEKLDKLIELQDKTNLKLHYIEEKVDRLCRTVAR